MKHATEQPVSRGGRILWLWVTLAFVILIGAWATLITIASTHKPEVIEIEKP